MGALLGKFVAWAIASHHDEVVLLPEQRVSYNLACGGEPRSRTACLLRLHAHHLNSGEAAATSVAGRVLSPLGHIVVCVWNMLARLATGVYSYCCPI